MLLDINYAWGIGTTRSKLQSRAIALVLVTALAVVIVVLLLSLFWLLKLVAGLFLTFWESVGILSLSAAHSSADHFWALQIWSSNTC